MSDIFVQSFTHLKDKRDADKALHTLQRVASLVKPIMRKRNWVLPVLAEFFPDNPSLLADALRTFDPGLNVNMGQKILVRLRPAHSPDSFLPEEDVVGTMLHELTHNVHGPHDETFYKYLDGLQDEYDGLQRSGYAGEGFFSEGKRLGANISHNVSPHIARQRALEAAEKRVKVSRLLGSGGRLGGSARNAGLSPRELSARAAEKRFRDEKSCASGADAQREADKAAKESVTCEVIDLTLDDDIELPAAESDSEVVIVKDLHPRSAASGIVGPAKKTISKPATVKLSSSKPSTGQRVLNLPPSSTNRSIRKTQPPRPSNVASEWSCSVCTLLNPANALQCGACQIRKPFDESEGWSCLKCGENGNPHEHWACKFCGGIKLQS